MSDGPTLKFKSKQEKIDFYESALRQIIYTAFETPMEAAAIFNTCGAVARDALKAVHGWPAVNEMWNRFDDEFELTSDGRSTQRKRAA